MLQVLKLHTAESNKVSGTHFYYTGFHRAAGFWFFRHHVLLDESRLKRLPDVTRHTDSKGEDCVDAPFVTELIDPWCHPTNGSMCISRRRFGMSGRGAGVRGLGLGLQWGYGIRF